MWTAADETASVGVYEFFGEVYAKAIDERTGAGVELFRIEFDTGDATGAAYTDAKHDPCRRGVEKAIAWMRETSPAEWSHPDICEAVFDAPIGYEYVSYAPEGRETIVYYRREDAAEVTRLAGAGEPDEYTRDTCPYLYIHVWNGSGNATVAIAPWQYAHGPGSKYPEVREVAETPDECGLEVALTVARQWAREQTGGSIEADAVGQTDLGRWLA